MLLRRDPPTDFALVVVELEKAGYRKKRQAVILNVPWPTFQRWAKGSQPMYEDARALLKLHKMVCKGEVTR